MKNPSEQTFKILTRTFLESLESVGATTLKVWIQECNKKVILRKRPIKNGLRAADGSGRFPQTFPSYFLWKGNDHIWITGFHRRASQLCNGIIQFMFLWIYAKYIQLTLLVMQVTIPGICWLEKKNYSADRRNCTDLRDLDCFSLKGNLDIDYVCLFTVCFFALLPLVQHILASQL